MSYTSQFLGSLKQAKLEKTTKIESHNIVWLNNRIYFSIMSHIFIVLTWDLNIHVLISWVQCALICVYYGINLLFKMFHWINDVLLHKSQNCCSFNLNHILLSKNWSCSCSFLNWQSSSLFLFFSFFRLPWLA